MGVVHKKLRSGIISLLTRSIWDYCFFFFQAEDGIRDLTVTGVQTCALPISLEESLIRRIKAALGRLDALVISDYDKGVVTDALADRVLTECHRRGVPVLVKPKTSRLFAYRGATAIVCNAKEAGFFVTRQLDDDESVGQAGRALLAHFGCSAVVITRGADGLSVFEDTAPRGFHVPATSREVSYARVGQTRVDHASHGRQVFDVTGAGDTVLSVTSNTDRKSTRLNSSHSQISYAVFCL